MSVEWDGVTKSSTVKLEFVAARHALADAAKSFDWAKVLELVAKGTCHVNSWRLDGESWYTPLHQAAYGNAPADVVERLIGLGAWRTLQNSKGERPIDIAEQRGHVDLIQPLEPVYKHKVPLGILVKIQAHFHSTIRERAAELVDRECLRLPELEVLLELDEPKMWFPVPGMYGGFSFWLESGGANAKLVSVSWCRVVGGSGQRHEITNSGSVLVDEGFV
ncbi:MAG: ankyrin repeat domain-containing protein [Thermoflexales bacterium]|nr:ankyrin repeat domain-containing protein [Thermoflexales bacterium]